MAGLAARVMALVFMLSAGQALRLVAGVEVVDRFWVWRVLVLVVVTMLIGETAWRFVWAAEDGEYLLSYLPALALAGGVPMAIAAHINQVGLAVAIGASLSSVLSAAVVIRRADRVTGQAVSS